MNIHLKATVCSAILPFFTCAASNDLFYYCTFDSDDAVKNPVVGSSGTCRNATYQAGKVGNALAVPAGRGVVSVPLPNGLPAEKGCIEFWAKLTSGKTNFSNLGDPSFFKVLKEGDSFAAERTEISTLLFTYNDGAGGGGLTYRLGGVYRATSSFYAAGDYSAVIGDPNAWHHYALVWNVEGIGGTSDNVRLYLDGTKYHSVTGVSADNFRTRMATSSVLWFALPFDSSLTDCNRSPFLIDEFKVWSKDQTRFAEPNVRDYSGVYDGREHSVLVEWDDGTVKYALDKEGPYSSTKPVFTDVVQGASVWYKVDDGEAKCATVTITPKPLASEMVKVSGVCYYDGSAHEPEFTVADGSPSIITASDWRFVEYGNNVEVGPATIRIVAAEDGNYCGEAVGRFWIVKEYEPDKLIYYCTFDSDDAVKNPVVGPSGTCRNATYQAGKVGNALAVPAGRGVVSVPLPNGLPAEKGCIEFWARLTSGKTSFLNLGDPSFFKVLKDGDSFTAERTEISTLLFTDNDGAGGGGLVYWLGGVYKTTSSSYAAGSYSSVIGDPAAWHHYALVWNVDGIGGTSENIRLYLDGTKHHSATVVSADNFKTRMATASVLWFTLPFDSTLTDCNRSPFLIDEFRIWSKDAVSGSAGRTFPITYSNLHGAMHSNPNTYVEGTSAAFTAPSERPGYTFIGWNPSAISVDMTGAQTVTAEWSANAYVVKFNANGGKGAMADEAMTYDAEKALTANAFTKTGYSFAGWATSAGGAVTYVDGASVKNLTAMAGGAVTLYAKWTPNSYVVDFNPGQGGTGTMPDQPMTYDEEAVLYANLFARTGYTFLGWSDDEDELEEVLFYDGVVVSNLTDEVDGEHDLYAVWTANEYTVRFDANGGEGTMSDQEFLYDEEQNLYLNSLTRVGYAFAGWATSAKGEVVYANGAAIKSIAASGVVTLYAKWTANTYSVNFNANGGSGAMANESMTYDVVKSLTACAFTRKGYTFAGWATSAGGTVKYANGAAVKNLATSGTVTLYAKWTPNNYVIDFNPGQGGTGTMPDQPMTYDEEAALYANLFARTGYAFLGWTDDEGELEEVLYYDGVVVSNLTDEVDGEFDLYAVWAANAYTVKFSANGGTGAMSDQEFLYDEEQNLYLNCFTRVGHSFEGWARSAKGAVAFADGGSASNLTSEADGLVTLYAQWSANPYTVKFDANGGEGEMSDMDCTYGVSKQLAFNAFTRVGYAFAGWATSAKGEVVYANGAAIKSIAASGVVTLYAKWTAISYSVKFNTNGGSGSMSNLSMTYDVEKALTACAFMKTGYMFAGWAAAESDGSAVYADGATVKNLTATQGAVVNLYAKWTANAYMVKFNANGGSGAMADEQMTYDAEKALTACAFTKTGYTFAGWAREAATGMSPPLLGDGAVVKNLAASGTVTLYAKWTPNNYVIDFNPGQDGEGSMPDQPMTYDEEAALYANLFARTGYTFLGWTDDPTEVEEVLYYDGVVVENLTDEVDGEYDLYAVWAANEYTVKFNANGGKGVMADQAFLYDEVQALRANGFVRAGCEFLGWAAIEDGGSTVYADGEAVSNLTVTADGVVNLYAVWDGAATTWMEDDGFSATVANTYDGYMIDENYNLLGIVQVKTTKQSVKTTTDKKTKVKMVTTNITATATVTDANGKKWSYSKGVVELLGSSTSGEDAASPLVGVVTGLKCTTKGCPVAEFGVTVGKNGMEGAWGEYAIFGARNGMGTKGDAMKAALEAYKGKWSVTMSSAGETPPPQIVRLQLDVQAKGVVKIAGNWENGAKVSASAQMVMGDGFAYVPMMVKSTKTSSALNALLRIDGEEVALVSGCLPAPVAEDGDGTVLELLAGGRTVAALEVVGYLAENPVKAGVAYVGRVAVNELAYPAKFTQKGLPTGLKINAATGVVSGTPTKPGEYVVTFTATSSLNSKSKDTVKVTIKVENYVDGLIPVEDHYGPYTPGVSYTVTIPAANGCKVSGLPTGMKWTAKDIKTKDGSVKTPANSVYGIPTKPGKYTVYFKKSVSELNAKNKSVKVTHTATATFEVVDYPTITILPSLAVAGSEPMAVVEGAALSFFVGVKQSFAINLAGTLDGVDTTVSAKGLPTGLKLVKKTIYVDPTAKKKVVDHYEYVIEGVPTKASSLDKQKNVVPSHVALTASNKYKWGGTFAFDITVVALPTWAYGTFDGGNTNGMATLTVSNVGKLSGKWLSAGLTWTLSAASFDAYIPSEQMYVATVIGKSGKLAMTNEVEVTEGGVSSPIFEAWRNGWKEEPLKTLAKNLKGQKVQVGEVLLTVGANGAVTAKGSFVPGFDEIKQKDVTYSATCSTVLIPTEEDGWYKVYLCFPPKSGKFDGFSACESVMFAP